MVGCQPLSPEGREGRVGFWASDRHQFCPCPCPWGCQTLAGSVWLGKWPCLFYLSSGCLQPLRNGLRFSLFFSEKRKAALRHSTPLGSSCTPCCLLATPYGNRNPCDCVQIPEFREEERGNGTGMDSSSDSEIRGPPLQAEPLREEARQTDSAQDMAEEGYTYSESGDNSEML